MIPDVVPYTVVSGTIAQPRWKSTCHRSIGRPGCGNSTAWLGYVSDNTSPSAWACATHKGDVEARVRELAGDYTYERAYSTPSPDEVERLIDALGTDIMDRIAVRSPDLPSWERRRGGVMVFLADGRTIEFCRHRTDPLTRPSPTPLWDIVWLDDDKLPYPLIPAAGDLELGELRSTTDHLVQIDTARAAQRQSAHEARRASRAHSTADLETTDDPPRPPTR